MAAAKYDLTISRGADFNFTLRILDINNDPASFTGSTDFKAEIREAYRRPLIAAFAFETNNAAGSSTTNAALADGEVKFILTAAQTSAMDVLKQYEWDFFWVDSAGLTHKLLQGEVAVDPNITNI